VLVHRPDENVVCAQQRGEGGINGAGAVEVDAEAHDHQRAAGRVVGEGGEALEERGSLALVRAHREHLLELVDGDDQPLAAGVCGQLPQWMRAGADDDRAPAAAAWKRSGGQLGQQSRLDERRLAAAGGADDTDKRRGRESRHQLADERLRPKK